MGVDKGKDQHIARVRSLAGSHERDRSWAPAIRYCYRIYQSAGIHLEKSPRRGKSTSEDILGGCAYNGQYSILKGCNSQGGPQRFKEWGGSECPPPPLNETLIRNIDINIPLFEHNDSYLHRYILLGNNRSQDLHYSHLYCLLSTFMGPNMLCMACSDLPFIHA